jgi:hypothetical protein
MPVRHLWPLLDMKTVRITFPSQFPVCILEQAVREGKQDMATLHKVFIDLLEDIKGRGPGLDPQTIAAHLLRIKDPKTGQLLPNEQLIPEVAVFFFAGGQYGFHN